MRIVITEGDLTAELRGRQWVVQDAAGVTVAWIVKAGSSFVVSVLAGESPGTFPDPRIALEALASRQA